MEYILKGNDKVISDIIKENSLRIKRGWVEFVPSNPALADDKENAVADTKEVVVNDKKTSKKRK